MMQINSNMTNYFNAIALITNYIMKVDIILFATERLWYCGINISLCAKDVQNHSIVLVTFSITVTRCPYDVLISQSNSLKIGFVTLAIENDWQSYLPCELDNWQMLDSAKLSPKTSQIWSLWIHMLTCERWWFSRWHRVRCRGLWSERLCVFVDLPCASAP